MSLSRQRPARAIRSTRPARRRVGGGWLSLFAMCMLFIGPLIAQSMPMNHHAGMAMNMDMPMDMAMTHGGASAHSGHGDHGDAGDGQLHVMWEKCGYCSLLFNCPALPQTLSPLALGHQPPPRQLAPPTRSGHSRQAIFPNARSRAPPLFPIV